MELEIRPPDREERAFRISITFLAILMILVVAMQFWGARVHTSAESSGHGQAITSGDYAAKCWVAWPVSRFADSALRAYRKALPWPSAYRRIGVLKQSLGRPGLSDLRKIDLPRTLHGLHLTKKQVAKLHQEKKMWLRVYGPEKLTADEAKRYAADIRKLNLGPLKAPAVASVYKKAGLTKLADKTTQDAREDNQAALLAAGALIALLVVGGIGGLVIAIVFLTNTVPRFSQTPLTRIRPSALIVSFIVYLASYIAIGGAADAFSETIGVDLKGGASGALFMGLTIVAAALAWMLGLRALIARLRPGESWREIGYRTVSAGRDALWGVAGYLASLPFLIVAVLVSAALSNTVFKHFPTPEQPFGEMVSRGSGLEVALVFLAASVVAPIVEETFFRGVLYSAFRGRMGVWPSIVVTSVLFAIIHPLPGGFIPIFTLACVLALLRERSGSLLPGMVCHGVYNTIGLILASLLM